MICVICGAVIPEGAEVCPSCRNGTRHLRRAEVIGWLMRGYLIKRRIEEQMDRIRTTKSKATRATSYIKFAPGGQGRTSRIEQYGISLVDGERDLYALECALFDHHVSVCEWACNLNAPERNVILRRYVRLQTWKDIAEEMHYSERWTYALHDRALRELSKIMTLNDIYGGMDNERNDGTEKRNSKCGTGRTESGE